MTELTIAHISDIHAGSPYFVPSLMDRVVIELNELKPDIVRRTETSPRWASARTT